jgi:signal transduction histidine kinase/HPt (histidine-containing phosphotransfer) domain-containing protein
MTNDRLQAGSPNERSALLAGRVAVLYALSQYYLFLPFAALCMAATIAHRPNGLWLTAAPFVLQIVATVAGNRLKQNYDARNTNDDPAIWLRRYTLFSAIVGAIWGFGAVVWFVPNEFPAQAYLCLAFLGMTATEFIVRAAYRPAYLAHASCSLGPLAVMLLLDGSSYAMLTSILVLFFGGVLYSYCEAIGKMIDDSVRLRHENALLVVRLSHEKREAEIARDAARASERAKSAFFATMSHELRTPLNAMLGMAQLLERSELGQTQREYVKVLLEGGRSLTTLLDDVIDLARNEDELPEAPKEGCNAGQAVRTVARLLQPKAWEKHLQLAVNVAPDLPRVAVDPRQLRRALLKLADNALKFTEKGSVDITVAPTAEPDGRAFVRFQITDTGPGVPIEVTPVLFDAFARADDSYARQHNGAGVGLAVAKRIVDAMGGVIGVDSEPGKGATFWFTVPISTTAHGENTEADKFSLDFHGADEAVDSNAFATLEKSVGLSTLVEILHSYMATAEGLTAALAGATEAQDWTQAGRLAQDIAGAAGGLGLVSLTAAARALAQASRDGKGSLYGAAQNVLTEHHRAKEALQRLYPALAA